MLMGGGDVGGSAAWDWAIPVAVLAICSSGLNVISYAEPEIRLCYHCRGALVGSMEGTEACWSQ